MRDSQVLFEDQQDYHEEAKPDMQQEQEIVIGEGDADFILSSTSY